MTRFLLVGLLLLPAVPASAGTVVVFETGGPGGGPVLKALVEVLGRELPEHQVVRKKRPRGWKVPTVKNAKTLAKAVRAAGADVGVDSMTAGKKKKRRVNILAVGADGTVVFDKAARLPKKKPDKMLRGFSKDIARATAEHLRNAAPAEEIAASGTGGGDTAPPAEFAGGGEAPTSNESPLAMSGSNSGGDQPSPLGLPKVEEEAPRRRSSRDADPFHLALRFGGGGLSYDDRISTAVQGGELQIKLGFTVLAFAGLEAEILELVRVSAVFRRYAAKMRHADTTNPAVNDVSPEVIDISALGGTGLVGAAYTMGPMSVGAMAGAAYDKLDAPRQTLVDSAGVEQTVALVPSWARLMVLAGIVLNYGGLANKGLAAQLGLFAAPWGSHNETPVTSGTSPSLFGGVGYLRLRFQMPRMFGDAGGLFAEVAGDVEWIQTQYKGNGTRTALGGTTPVQASKETRLSFSGSAGVGYVF